MRPSSRCRKSPWIPPVSRSSARSPASMQALPWPYHRVSFTASTGAPIPWSMRPRHVVSGDAALAALPPTRRAGSKPFAIEGLNEANQQWETPAPGQRYQSFQAGVQLANRMGALNEIEFSEFVVKAQAFADAINAAPDF